MIQPTIVRYLDIHVYTNSTAPSAVAEVNRKPIGEVGCWDGRANPLIDRKVVGVVFVGVVAMVAVVTSPTTAAQLQL